MLFVLFHLDKLLVKKIVTHMIPYIEETRKQIFELKEADFGMTAPGLEPNQMAHENVNVRIFIS